MMVVGTNATAELRSGHTHRSSKWQSTNPTEMFQFVAALLYMGLVKLPTIDSYFQSKTLYRNNMLSRYFIL